jgi:hypothetical protein
LGAVKLLLKVSGNFSERTSVLVEPEGGRDDAQVCSVLHQKNVRPSEAILALKPVTFRSKKELDPEGIPQFGLVAEDVEKNRPRSSGP